MNSDIEAQMQKHSEEYYLTVVCDSGIFRLSNPRYVHDIILGVQSFYKRASSARALTSIGNYQVFYKGIQIVGNLQGAGIPSGARIEVRSN